MLKIVFLILFSYLGLCAFLYFFQERLLFPRMHSDFFECPARIPLGAEAKTLNQIRYYEKRNPSYASTLIYFNGNGGRACDRIHVIEDLSGLPLNFIFVEYPGYAESRTSVVPSEKQILKEALQIFDHLRAEHPQERIFIFGESLGSGVATFLGANREVSGIILQAPYTSLAEVGQTHYPLFPVSLLLKHPFRASEWAPSVKAPVLILRAERDEIIPPEISLQQIDNFAASRRPKVITLNGATHNTMSLLDADTYWKAIREFLQGV